MRKTTWLAGLSLVFVLLSCTPGAAQKQNGKTKKTQFPYVPTGFYALSETEGVLMEKETTGEIYRLNPTPLVSVKNIASTKLETKQNDGAGEYAALYLYYDEKGTAALASVTGNPAYPQLAIVIAGKLVYVVSNKATITKGVMCILLTNYTPEELTRMQKAVNRKK